ncbi:hypothetical protein DPMN_068942 [Dreissena polymorpha]|uniref:Uncharacterized protein n=1 Tax=Dreissena polymorpha TaxID=45954 RepID=A0A9D3Z0N0_DREPO|nr:hypothetical protein DPMN_068942 [Dreissena polymorpha]
MCMQVIKQGSNGGNMLPAALGAGCAAFVIIAIAVAVGVFVHIRGSFLGLNLLALRLTGNHKTLYLW